MRAILVIILIALSTTGRAQSFYGWTSGNIDIYSVLNVSLTNLSGVVTFSNLDDYFNGQTISNSATVAIKSNSNWQVSISAQSANFQAMSSSSSTNMPASIVGIRRNGTTTFLTMSTTAQTLKTGSRGNAATSGNTFNIDMRLTPGFAYNGGVYNLGVLFTLTQQ